MIRSLYSGVSGLRNHQVRMDVIANNIANVNTTGFKSSRANFQDILAQTIGRTAINTTQVGLGMGLAAIDNVFTQGALQTTGRVLDLAIEGNGFFVVQPVLSDGNTSEQALYTRDGTFYIDKDGYLVNAQGYRVYGENDVDLETGTGTSGSIKFDGPTDTPKTPDQIVTISVGSDGIITATYSDGTQEIARVQVVTFVNTESLTRVGANLWDITPGLTAPTGELDGGPKPGTPGQDGRGIIRSGYLEMSNVDLALEFTTMIVTQRGYQANARIITTSDEMLRELIDLKR